MSHYVTLNIYMILSFLSSEDYITDPVLLRIHRLHIQSKCHICFSKKRKLYGCNTCICPYSASKRNYNYITIIFPFIPSSLLNHNNASISHSYESQGYSKPELSVKWWLQIGHHLNLIKFNHQIRGLYFWYVFTVRLKVASEIFVKCEFLNMNMFALIQVLL